MHTDTVRQPFVSLRVNQTRHTNIHHTCGLNFLSSIFDGIFTVPLAPCFLAIHAAVAPSKTCLEDHVGDEEYRERRVVFGSFDDVQVFWEFQHCCVADVYPMNQTTPRSIYILEDSLDSSYRSRNASKYMTHRQGTRCQSILAMSLRSVVCVRHGRPGGAACAGDSLSSSSSSMPICSD